MRKIQRDSRGHRFLSVPSKDSGGHVRVLDSILTDEQGSVGILTHMKPAVISGAVFDVVDVDGRLVLASRTESAG